MQTQTSLQGGTDKGLVKLFAFVVVIKTRLV